MSSFKVPSTELNPLFNHNFNCKTYSIDVRRLDIIDCLISIDVKTFRLILLIFAKKKCSSQFPSFRPRKQKIIFGRRACKVVVKRVILYLSKYTIRLGI